MTLTELQKLCDEATPGPWEEKGSVFSYYEFGPLSGTEQGLCCARYQDLEFIAAAREWMPKLIEAVRAASHPRITNPKHEDFAPKSQFEAQEKLRAALAPFRGEG